MHTHAPTSSRRPIEWADRFESGGRLTRDWVLGWPVTVGYLKPGWWSQPRNLSRVHTSPAPQGHTREPAREERREAREVVVPCLEGDPVPSPGVQRGRGCRPWQSDPFPPKTASRTFSCDTKGNIRVEERGRLHEGEEGRWREDKGGEGTLGGDREVMVRGAREQAREHWGSSSPTDPRLAWRLPWHALVLRVATQTMSMSLTCAMLEESTPAWQVAGAHLAGEARLRSSRVVNHSDGTANTTDAVPMTRSRSFQLSAPSSLPMTSRERFRARVGSLAWAPVVAMARVRGLSRSRFQRERERERERGGGSEGERARSVGQSHVRVSAPWGARQGLLVPPARPDPGRTSPVPRLRAIGRRGGGPREGGEPEKAAVPLAARHSRHRRAPRFFGVQRALGEWGKGGKSNGTKLGGGGSFQTRGVGGAREVSV